MITGKDIRHIRHLVGRLRVNLGLFLNGNIDDSKEHILKYEFPRHEKKLKRIEDLLSEYFDFALNSIKSEKMIEKVFVEEFLAFKHAVVAEFYKDFQRNARRDILTEFQEKIIREDFDTDQWRLDALKSEGYFDHKVALYDILEAYANKIQNISVDKPEPLLPKSVSLKPISSESKYLRFNKPETIDAIYEELKYYFSDREEEFKNALKGTILTEPLLFQSNQNQLTEVFRRLKYNGFLLSSKTEIKNWLCTNFMYHHRRGLSNEIRHFNANSVWDILAKTKGLPEPHERLCKVDWLPFKTLSTLQKEKQLEK